METIVFFACSSSQEFFDSPAKDKKKLRKLFKMEEVEIYPCADFVGHYYLHYTGGSWKERYFLQYNTCMISKGVDLKNAV